jgi:hypothetical protein
LGDWTSVLKADSTDWLLGTDNPSVRYFTLTELLERPETETEVISAKSEIMQIGPVPRILGKQHNKGYWETSERFYTAKYKGTAWQLIILAELGAE